MLDFKKPSDCYMCPLSTDECICIIQDSHMDIAVEWCPLRELPKKLEDNTAIHMAYNEGYLNGWNDCVDAIGGAE